MVLSSVPSTTFSESTTHYFKNVVPKCSMVGAAGPSLSRLLKIAGATRIVAPAIAHFLDAMQMLLYWLM